MFIHHRGSKKIQCNRQTWVNTDIYNKIVTTCLHTSPICTALDIQLSTIGRPFEHTYNICQNYSLLFIVTMQQTNSLGIFHPTTFHFLIEFLKDQVKIRHYSWGTIGTDLYSCAVKVATRSTIRVYSAWSKRSTRGTNAMPNCYRLFVLVVKRRQ